MSLNLMDLEPEIRLKTAQKMAWQLLDLVEEQGWICPGAREQGLSDDIAALAREKFGIEKHWHKRLVRSGPNTQLDYDHNPPDRTLEADDIVYLDFGPIFESYAADVGRTVVLGYDPIKHRLKATLETLFNDCKAFYRENPDLTGAAFYAEVVRRCEAAGYTYGSSIAGHWVGRLTDRVSLREHPGAYICKTNDIPMSTPDENGLARHWILEIHLVLPDYGFGGFMEDLLTLDGDWQV
jgi:Xaa-Pro aminopeptidase